MLRGWFWRRYRSPARLRFDGAELLAMTVHVGCVRSPQRASRACGRLSCDGTLLWIETSGSCGADGGPDAHRVSLDEDAVADTLALVERLAGFDAVLVTVASTWHRAPDGGRLARTLAAAAAGGRVNLAVVGVGAAGWDDPLLRALAAQGLRLSPAVPLPRARASQADPVMAGGGDGEGRPEGHRDSVGDDGGRGDDLPVQPANGKT